MHWLFQLGHYEGSNLKLFIVNLDDYFYRC